MRSFPGLGSSEIILRNSLVYMGSDDGVLHVVRQAGGKTKWTYRSGRQGMTGAVVDRGKVWLSISDGSLHALDAFTGRRLWVHEPKAAGVTRPSNIGLFPGPAVLHGKLYQREGRSLVAVSEASGRTVTSIALPRGELTYPVSTGRNIVVGVDGQLYALSPQLDAVVWRANLQGQSLVTPILVEERLFTGTAEGRVFALDGTRGKILWRYGDLPAPVIGLSSDGSLLFVATADGNVYAFDAQSGRLRWRFDTEGSFISPAVTSGSSVMFGSNDGRLYSVNSETGGFEWSYDTGDSYMRALAIQDDVVYFAAHLPSGTGGSTRLASLDITGLLAGLTSLSTGPLQGRRSDQDAVSVVLVDGTVAAARQLGPRGGTLAPLAWPYRYLSAAGNPHMWSSLASRSRDYRASDSLAYSAAVLGLTSGPVAAFTFLGVFFLSVVGNMLMPTLLPILGVAGAAEGPPNSARVRLLPRVWHLVWRDRPMLAIAYGVELAVLPVFVGIRLLAGPADTAATFMISAVLSGMFALLVAAGVRAILLQRAAGQSESVRSESPVRLRAGGIYRILVLYVLCALALGACFVLMELAAALQSAWLLVPVVVIWAGCGPAMLADAHIVVFGASLPTAFIEGARSIARRPGGAVVYGLVAFCGLVVPAAIGAFTSEFAGLIAALALCPCVAGVLAAAGVEICA